MDLCNLSYYIMYPTAIVLYRKYADRTVKNSKPIVTAIDNDDAY